MHNRKCTPPSPWIDWNCSCERLDGYEIAGFSEWTCATKVDEAIRFGVTESENATIFHRNSSLRE